MQKWIFFTGIIFCSSNLFSQTIQLEEFSSGYFHPTDIENCGDSRLFIVQKDGYIYISDSAGNKISTPFLDIHNKVQTPSERGLLGLAFPPDYFMSGYFFVYYSPKGTDTNVIARFKVDALNPDHSDTLSEQIIFKIPHPTYDNHDGGCLKFGRDGYLYAGTGDGGSAGDPDNNAQNRKNYLGKLLRFDVSVDSGYVVPPDNPFVNDTTFFPEIWALGLRNPWRFSFDHLTHDLWIGDVGQDTWEEVDLINAIDTGGQDYGWDCYEGLAASETAHCTNAGTLTWPIHVYQHLNGECSITGGFVYRGAQFKNFYGKYIFVDYCTGKFRIMDQDGNGDWYVTEPYDGANSDFVAFGEDRYQELYVSAYTDGKIYRLTDTACMPVAQVLIDYADGDLIIDSAACGPNSLQTPFGVDLTYQWLSDGNIIPGSTSNVFFPPPTDSIYYSVIVTSTNGCSSISNSVLVGGTTVAPQIIGLDSLYCVFQAPDTLTGIPSGGTFYGDGIIGNIFYPALAGIGSHGISYNALNQYHCFGGTYHTVIVDACLGLNNLWNESGINIFPNPSGGQIQILFEQMNDSNIQISVLNIAGAIVFSKEYSAQQIRKNLITLDLSSLVNGVYAMKVNRENGQGIFKFVIQH